VAILEVADLHTRFRTDDGIVKAVSGVTFQLDRGETLGVVGESGSGKSVTFLTVMGLVDRRHAEVEGSVLFHGDEILGASSSRLQKVRGRRIGMIFQDPMTSLNPVKKIGWQLEEAVLLHNDVTRDEARRRSIDILKEVEIPRAETRVDDYPHQFSGGMRQRVMIAMALINNPEVLIADEPTTALDVTTQAQILRLMTKLQREHEMAIVMITHDLGVVAELANDVLVMYGGRVVEQAHVDDLFAKPEMPYTWGLLGSLPRLDITAARLEQIPGQPPSLLHPPRGCAFNPRCAYAFDRCREELPELRTGGGVVGEGHRFRCHLADEERARIWDAKKAALAASSEGSAA
jgi:peptide/nickel transport system ATP-binding protein